LAQDVVSIKSSGVRPVPARVAFTDVVFTMRTGHVMPQAVERVCHFGVKSGELAAVQAQPALQHRWHGHWARRCCCTTMCLLLFLCSSHEVTALTLPSQAAPNASRAAQADRPSSQLAMPNWSGAPDYVHDIDMARRRVADSCRGKGWAETLRQCGWASTMRLWLSEITLSTACEPTCMSGFATAASRSKDATVYKGARQLGGAKSRILYHHIWKCGGAELCSEALRNGEATPNGLAKNPSERCGASSFNPEEWLVANYSFVAWQAPLPPGPPVGSARSQFASVVVLRNPLDQAVSHFRHAQLDYGLWGSFGDFIEYGLCVGARAEAKVDEKDILTGCGQWLAKEAGAGKTPGFHGPPGPRPPLTFLQPFTLFRDNQQTRWLAPGVELSLSVGSRPSLGPADLAAAKARLAEFDEVLILEEFDKRDRFRLLKYGWSDLRGGEAVGADVHQIGQGKPLRHARSNATYMLASQSATLAKLRKIQSFDLELYEHARNLARQQAKASSSIARPLLSSGNGQPMRP